MSSSTKRKWDQAADEPAPKAQKTEESQSASAVAAAAKVGGSADAASAAAAIAAKIAAQFGARDEAEFTHDIDINDVRNRYLLTKGQTQEDIKTETGAVVSTKGIWYPDRAKATDRDPPLYLHIAAKSRDQLQKAIDKVNELLALEMGSLIDDRRRDPGYRRKWPEEKVMITLEPLRNFNVRAKVVGPGGMFVKYIQQETGTRVQIKGQGSGFVEVETGRESEDPMHIHITGPEEAQIARAKVLTEDLLEVVRGEHNKALAVLHQQQMEMQYAAYGQQGPMDHAQVTQYYASLGYDVNSDEFKQWQAGQYAQYYGGQPGAQAPAPPGEAPPPPPPPSDGIPPPPPS